MRRLLAISLLMLTLPCAAASPDAADLLARLKREPPAHTPYTEVRFSSLLDRPLVLHGELDYLGPSKLGKRVDKPYRETTTIADGQVSVEREGRAARRFTLGDAPELEGFLRGFTALLGGDANALAGSFKLVASGDEAHWRLALTPTDARLAQRIAAIEVDGAGRAARCFRVREADGDVSFMLVEALATAALPTPATPQRLAATCSGAADK